MKAKVHEDIDDIPMAYLWYVVFTIMAIVVTGVVVVIALFPKI